ncbi:hypothetical protein [Streptomyces sp. NPDC003697]
MRIGPRIGNLRADPDTSRVTAVEDFYRKQDSMVDVKEMTPEEKAERSRAQAKIKSDPLDRPSVSMACVALP